MISTAEARRIAGDWHGGQFSPFYAFSSTGTVLEGFKAELRDCQLYAARHLNEERKELFRLAVWYHLEGQYREVSSDEYE